MKIRLTYHSLDKYMSLHKVWVSEAKKKLKEKFTDFLKKGEIKNWYWLKKQVELLDERIIFQEYEDATVIITYIWWIRKKNKTKKDYKIYRKYRRDLEKWQKTIKKKYRI